MASASAVDPQSLNLFAYVTNNPVDFVDPEGLNALPPDYAPDFETWFIENYPDIYWEQFSGNIAKSYGAIEKEFGRLLTEMMKSPLGAFGSLVRLSVEECDKHMSKIFGGVVKAMEDGGDIGGRPGRHSFLKDGLPLYGHSATPNDQKPLYKKIEGEWIRDTERGGIIHAYTDESGSNRNDVPMTIPGGWIGTPISYNRGGGIGNGLIVRYPGGITIELVHIGTSSGSGKSKLPQNAGIGDLVEIGTLAGPGGASRRGYAHSHIVFILNKANGTREDPRKIFCGWQSYRFNSQGILAMKIVKIFLFVFILNSSIYSQELRIVMPKGSCELNNRDFYDLLLESQENNERIFIFSRRSKQERAGVDRARLRYTVGVLTKIFGADSKNIVSGIGERSETGLGYLEVYLGSKIFLRSYISRNQQICLMVPDYELADS